MYKNNGLLFCNRCGDEPNFPRETGGTIEGGVGLLMYFQINTVVCVCAFGLCVALGEGAYSQPQQLPSCTCFVLVLPGDRRRGHKFPFWTFPRI